MTVPVDSRIADWPRRVANAINALRRGFDQRETLPFQMLDAEPADAVEAQTYYDTVTKKVRTYDGTAWNDHW